MSGEVTATRRATYLDSSAIVKLVVSEVESDALYAHLRTRSVLVSSALARVEVIRAVRRHGPLHAARAARVLGSIRLLDMDHSMLDAAASLDPITLRSLDAIHLAAALVLGNELDEVITYDQRMAEVAEALGIAVTNPS